MDMRRQCKLPVKYESKQRAIFLKLPPTFDELLEVSTINWDNPRICNFRYFPFCFRQLDLDYGLIEYAHGRPAMNNSTLASIASIALSRMTPKATLTELNML